MPKTRTTLTLDEDVFRAVKVKAARTGKRDSQVIEEALRRDLGLGALEDIWARVEPAPEAEALRLANAELHAMREEKRETGRP
jgi:Ribbon-helix-helix protein, copG family